MAPEAFKRAVVKLCKPQETVGQATWFATRIFGSIARGRLKIAVLIQVRIASAVPGNSSQARTNCRVGNQVDLLRLRLAFIAALARVPAIAPDFGLSA